jgi:hypothetical protein
VLFLIIKIGKEGAGVMIEKGTIEGERGTCCTVRVLYFSTSFYYQSVSVCVCINENYFNYFSFCDFVFILAYQILLLFTLLFFFFSIFLSFFVPFFLSVFYPSPYLDLIPSSSVSSSLLSFFLSLLIPIFFSLFLFSQDA